MAHWPLLGFVTVLEVVEMLLVRRTVWQLKLAAVSPKPLEMFREKVNEMKVEG